MTALLLVVHAALALSAITISILGVQARRSDRSRSLAAWLLAVVGTQTIVGDVLYPTYLRTAKPALRMLTAGARSAADIFEVKEHLAFVALACAIGAFVITRTEPKPDALVRVLFGSAHGAIVLVAVLGLVVASLRLP
jgi:hypothetical protein